MGSGRGGGQRRLLPLALPVALVALLGSALTALADPSLGNWNPSPGAYLINTTALTISAGATTLFTGQDDGGIATFTFAEVDIPLGATVSVLGDLPLELISTGGFTLSGTVSGDGGSASDFTDAGGSPGGAGGGKGGPGGRNAGSGAGGGQPSTGPFSGGGGGGFGGSGAEGGTYLTPAGGLGGPTYGDLLTSLQAGSGGSGGWSGPDGGGGGGAIEILDATGSISITASGRLQVVGGSGACGGTSASGAGSGGGLLLVAHSLSQDGLVSADGGEGGGGGPYGGGGGGGGGRIVVLSNAFAGSGTTAAQGGQSYVASTTGRCGGSTGTEPDPFGAAGQVLLETPSSTTTFSPSPSAAQVGSEATLGATVSAEMGPLPTGAVSFSDASGTLCTASLTAGVSTSTGSCSYLVAVAGADVITASYDPSGPDASSTAAVTVSNTAAAVPTPVTGASPGLLPGLLGAAALLAGLTLLALAGVRRRRGLA